jgi:sugar phosphate permease
MIIKFKSWFSTYAMGWVICMLGAIFYCYEYLLRMEPSVMVPELMQAFQINATQFGILIASYYFIYSPMQIVVGLLTDLYGPRRILTIAVLSCAIGSFVFGVAHTFQVAALGRLLIGFGSAFAFVGVLKLSANWLPERYFGLFVGVATALGMLGGMLGDIVLSVFVHRFGWQETITVGTILGLILMPLIWSIVRDAPFESKAHVKLVATESKYKQTFVGFVQILKNPQMWLNGMIACVMYLSLSLFAELWGIPFLHNVYNLSANSAASACSMIFLGWLVGGPLAGYISDYFGMRRLPILIGCLVSTILISVIIYVPAMPLVLLYGLLFAFGVFSSFEVICFAISRDISNKKLVATAAAFTNCLTMLGGIACQPLIGKILDAMWGGELINGIRGYSAANYRYALTVLPVGLLLGLILSFWLRETTKNT